MIRCVCEDFIPGVGDGLRRGMGCLEKWMQGIMLIGEVKLTDFGAASPSNGLSKEDERSAALAARAQKGDYDDGSNTPHILVKNFY